MSPIVITIIAIICLIAGCVGGFAFFRYILTGKYKETLEKQRKMQKFSKRKNC